MASPPPPEPPLFSYLRSHEVGSSLSLLSPFGLRPILYADHTASGRSLAFLESFLLEKVLPNYGNTHTSSSKTGKQSSDFVSEARTLAKVYTRCSKRDRMLFVGSGATAAANALVAMLGLRPRTPREREREREALGEAGRPVVFVGPYEHHSNLLPWRDSIADVVHIGEAREGSGPDMEELERELKKYAHRPLRVGAFSAVSNVTGLITDADAVCRLCHKHGALAVWDYASAAPHTLPDMNPPAASAEDAAAIAKDAAFWSMHKLAGGPQAPGVLAFKADAILGPKAERRSSTVTPGGGTVFYVTESEHIYLHDDEERLEGGTPAIVGAIRAGLVLQLQHSVGAAAIHAADERIVSTLFERWRTVPNLLILGGTRRPRVPTFAFAVAVPWATARTGAVGGRLLLHHNYVVALLNDLFGIQARGGCMCAGPYSQSLLGIDTPTSDAILRELRRKEDNELLRPGYVRISLPYYASAPDIAYIGDAVAFIAEHGHSLLSQYVPDPATAEWRHVHQRRPPREWLGAIDYSSGTMRIKPPTGSGAAATPKPTSISSSTDNETAAADSRAAALAEAMAHVNVARSQLKLNDGSSVATAAVLSPEAEALRWFLLPAEAATALRGVRPTAMSPFWPPCVDGHHGGANQELKDGRLLEAQGAPGALCASSTLAGGVAPAACAPTSGWVEPSRKLVNKVLRAVLQHGMLRPGDRVLLGLSGGKDSLTLLHALRSLQQRTPFKWELGACTVDPMADGFDPSPLIPYLAHLGVPYFYERENILGYAAASMGKNNNRVSICAFCSRMKRGVLYRVARTEKYNIIAMAHHLDDCAESFLMSALHNGALRTMKAHYAVDEGDLRVIRPLVYVREAEAEKFADDAMLPVVPENCPACFESPKERYRIKCLLATQEALFPILFQNLTKTLVPLMEPRVEDFLRLRREAYGRTGGNPHVPPPLPPPSEQQEEAARRAQATHNGYDARALWTASLALNRQRLSSYGRGCSQSAADVDEEAMLAEEAALAANWFGGSIDASGRFQPSGGARAHKHSTKGRAKGGGQAREANGEVSTQRDDDATSPSASQVWKVAKTSSDSVDTPMPDVQQGVQMQEAQGTLNVQSGLTPVASLRDWRQMLASTTSDDTQSRHVVIVFSASWCSACKRVLPMLEEVAADLRPRGVTMAIADADDAEDLAADCAVKGLPTVQLYRTSNPAERIAEVCGADEEAIRQLLAQANTQLDN